MAEEGVKCAVEWKQSEGWWGWCWWGWEHWGASGVDRLQMCLSDKLKGWGVFALQY